MHSMTHKNSSVAFFLQSRADSMKATSNNFSLLCEDCPKRTIYPVRITRRPPPPCFPFPWFFFRQPGNSLLNIRSHGDSTLLL